MPKTKMRARYRSLNHNPFKQPLPPQNCWVDADLDEEQVTDAERLARMACPEGYEFLDVGPIEGSEK